MLDIKPPSTLQREMEGAKGALLLAYERVHEFFTLVQILDQMSAGEVEQLEEFVKQCVSVCGSIQSFANSANEFIDQISF